MNNILVAIHGILTSQTEPSWPDKLDAWMYRRDPTVKVLKKEYRAGPFPRWNCWIKNPLLARSLANELELFLCPGEADGRGGLGKDEAASDPPSNPQIRNPRAEIRKKSEGRRQNDKSTADAHQFS